MKHANISIIKTTKWLVRVNESYGSFITSHSNPYPSLLAARQYVAKDYSDYTSVYCQLIIDGETIRIKTEEDWAMALLTYS